MEYPTCIHGTGIVYLQFFCNSTIHCTLPKFNTVSSEHDGFQSRNLLFQGSIFRWTMLNFGRAGEFTSPMDIKVLGPKSYYPHFEQPIVGDIWWTKTWVAGPSVVSTVCFWHLLCTLYPQQIGEKISNLTCAYLSEGLFSNTNDKPPKTNMTMEYQNFK